MSVSAVEQDRVWKKILKKKGLSLDTPLSTEGCFEWPPKNTTLEQQCYDYMATLERVEAKRDQMGVDVYDKMMEERKKRLRKIFDAEYEMEKWMKKAAEDQEKKKKKKRKRRWQ
ncbi:hypothetical protein Tco_1041730 [Tanacetum coccineum]|uniref:39S ribosomal protein L59, mitochondrial n=1 Tax=Tanacetum coccineum TaxID=301880 RepID=A0ABQ5GGY9_9ASTR